MKFDKYQTKGAYHFDWYNSGQPTWYKKSVDRCVAFCKGSTLDIGCGDGLVLDRLESAGVVASGIDNDPFAIRLCNERALNAYPYDIAKTLPLRADYMVCLNVIEHLEHPKAIKRIFDKNIAKAAIIITDMPQEKPSKYHVKEFSPYELRQMFANYKVKWFKIDDNFHGIEVYK